MNKFTITGGALGVIIGIIHSIYYASKSSCIGSYLEYVDPNGNPVLGNVCPKVSIIDNLRTYIIPDTVVIIALLLIGVLIGWIIGKIKNRQQVSVIMK